MSKKQSFRSQAVHFVSDLTTVLLNPISDNNNNNNNPYKPSLPLSEEEVGESKGSESEGRHAHDLVDGPDTSSFTAFLYSLLTSSDSGDNLDGQNDDDNDDVSAGDDPLSDSDSGMKENFVVKTSLFSRSKQSLGRAIHQAARMGGFRIDNFENKSDDGRGIEMKRMQPMIDPLVPLVDHHHLPEISEPSMLISDNVRNAVYASLPALIHGRKWLLLYSTWKHGISLSTLYRRSMLWPGLSLLVVGDRKGAVFGGLVEAPLRPSNKRKYQGTNNSFVFTNTSGLPVIYSPTGVNRYFTLCTTDFLAIGGGGHFALYLDGDLILK